MATLCLTVVPVTYLSRGNSPCSRKTRAVIDAIQGCSLASGIEMYTAICPGDVPFIQRLIKPTKHYDYTCIKVRNKLRTMATMHTLDVSAGGIKCLPSDILHW